MQNDHVLSTFGMWRLKHRAGETHLTEVEVNPLGETVAV